MHQLNHDKEDNRVNTSYFSSAPHVVPADRDTQYRACPRCKGTAVRIRRRSIDRFISHFRTVHRYQCLSLHCGWKGNLRPDYNHSKQPANSPTR